MTRLLVKSFIFMLIGIFVITSAVIPAVEARMIDTTAYLDQHNNSAWWELAAFMAREDVSEKVASLGVKPDDAANRIATLTE